MVLSTVHTSAKAHH